MLAAHLVVTKNFEIFQNYFIFYNLSIDFSEMFSCHRLTLRYFSNSIEIILSKVIHLKKTYLLLHKFFKHIGIRLQISVK